MLQCKESGGNIQRNVLVTIKPTPTEIADAIWNMCSDEQVTLLCCLKRRFCRNFDGSMQLADISSTLSMSSKERSSDAKIFVKHLADFILSDDDGWVQGGKHDTEAED